MCGSSRATASLRPSRLWIWGYKPAPNYQDALFDAVSRHLDLNRRIAETTQVAKPIVADIDEIFTSAPIVAPRPTIPSLERLVRKFDPVERDFRNRQLGRAGEEFVVDLERRRLAHECQTASKIDPGSACNIAPLSPTS